MNQPTERAVEDAVDALAGTEGGLIVAGASSDDLRPLVALSEHLAWPLLAEPASNLRIPGTISTYDALLRVSAFAKEHRPDVVLRTGKLSLGRPLARLLKDTRQIALDRHGLWLDEHRTVEHLITGDVATLCSRLITTTEPKKATAWSEGWRDGDAAARAAIDDAIDSFDVMSEPRIARDLAAALPDGANLFAASSMPVRDLESFMTPRDGITVYANRGTNGIDGTVSTVLGIAAASARPTYGLLGDIAMLHDGTGLLYDGDANATFVVVNNDGGAIFSFLEQAGVEGFERVFGTPHGRSFAEFARFHRLEHVSVGSPVDLGSAVPPSPGRRIVEVRTDRSVNVEHHRTVWAAVERTLQA